MNGPLSFRYLSYQFNVTIPTISKHFYKCLHELHKKLKKFVYWPKRDAIKKTTPLSFQNCFGNSITVIIDCFEIYIEIYIIEFYWQPQSVSTMLL